MASKHYSIKVNKHALFFHQVIFSNENIQIKLSYITTIQFSQKKKNNNLEVEMFQIISTNQPENCFLNKLVEKSTKKICHKITLLHITKSTEISLFSM